MIAPGEPTSTRGAEIAGDNGRPLMQIVRRGRRQECEQGAMDSGGRFLPLKLLPLWERQ